MRPDPDRLDDAAVLAAGDPAGMLRAVATSAAQVRIAATLTAEAGLAELVAAGRPRALVVAGMGGSGVSGDVLAAVVGPGCPVPVVAHRGYGLPGWVGAADLVAAVSCSGRTAETLSAAEEAVRRGARLLCVGAEESPLAERAEQARALYVPVRGAGQPRSALWSLATPLVALAGALRLLPDVDAQTEAAATRLELVAQACRPDRDTLVNPAKSLAAALAGTLPLVWGAGPLPAAAAARAATQLAENAGYPAIAGVLPEAAHNQVVTFDGPYAAQPGDLFRDRVDEPESIRLALLLLRDPAGEPAPVARGADAARELARARGLEVHEVVAEGGPAYERLACLVGLLDFASVYLALLYGADPTPVAAIAELKERAAG